MKKNNLSSYFLIIAIMTFVTLFTFIVSTSYSRLTSSINLAQSNPLGKSIDLNLKTDIINIIESRQKFKSDSQL